MVDQCYIEIGTLTINMMALLQASSVISGNRHIESKLTYKRLFPRPRKGFFASRTKMQAADGSSNSSSSVAPDLSRWESKIKKARYGKPVIVEPKGKHLASVVWLHGLGDSGYSWASILKTFPLPNIKWIVPTAPTRPVTVNGGFPCNAWFDIGALSADAPDDVEGLDTSAAFVASLLSKEPLEVKRAVGGFSQGGATSLYTATRFAIGKYSDGTPFHGQIDAAVSISGWLPCAKQLKSQVLELGPTATKPPLFLGHGTSDYVVSYKFGEMSATALQAAGFTTTFKTYRGLDHSTTPDELDDICSWLRKELHFTDTSK